MHLNHSTYCTMLSPDHTINNCLLLLINTTISLRFVPRTTCVCSPNFTLNRKANIDQKQSNIHILISLAEVMFAQIWYLSCIARHVD